jgi:hypothetical protein
MSFTHEQISERTFKVVENDPFGQYPFMYVIIGADKCILIDTGCGKEFYNIAILIKIWQEVQITNLMSLQHSIPSDYHI